MTRPGRGTSLDCNTLGGALADASCQPPLGSDVSAVRILTPWPSNRTNPKDREFNMGPGLHLFPGSSASLRQKAVDLLESFVVHRLGGPQGQVQTPDLENPTKTDGLRRNCNHSQHDVTVATDELRLAATTISGQLICSSRTATRIPRLPHLESAYHLHRGSHSPNVNLTIVIAPVHHHEYPI